VCTFLFFAEKRYWSLFSCILKFFLQQHHELGTQGPGRDLLLFGDPPWSLATSVYVKKTDRRIENPKAPYVK
jgi:hypothetical protein